MKRVNLKKMTIDEILNYTVEISLAQDQATLYDDSKKFNRLYKKMEEVDKEMMTRGMEARLALCRLYMHPNTQVRYNAAIYTLAVAPVGARAVLQYMKDYKEYPQAIDAALMMRSLDDGSFKPE